MQLVKPGVRLYDPMKSKVLGNKEVKEKFGVEPSKVVDVQALAGDSSDNVPGVPGIGIKTAAELINKYKSLETLLEKAHEIPQNKRRETILKNKNKAILSRKLVELKNDVPVKQKIETFTLKKINKEKLYDFLREMEFNRLLSQVISHYGESTEKKVEKYKNSTKFDLKKYQTILKINELEKWIKKIEEKGIVAVDTETSSLNPHEANLVGISLCSGPGIACYIPLEHVTEKVLEKKVVLKKLKNILQDNSILSLIKKRTHIVNYMLGLKQFKNQIVDRKRVNAILKNIRKKSLQHGIDPKITSSIWKTMIWSYIAFQRKNFRKK